MTMEASPDALTEALMQAIAQEQEGSPPEGGEETLAAAPTPEPEQPESARDNAPPSTELDPAVLETWYSRRREEERSQEQVAARVAELEKLIEEGDEAELGRRFRQEYAEAKAKAQYSQETTTTLAQQWINSALDKEFIDSLTDEQAVELHQLATDLKVPQFLHRVIEIKGSKAETENLDDIIERKVQERLQAAQNAQRGQQVRTASATSIPTATGGETPRSSNDDLWAAAMSEMAQSYQ